MNGLKRACNAIVAAAFLASTNLPALAQQTARETVQELATLFSAWNGNKHAAIFEEAAKRIDYGQMAEMSFTKPQWDKFSAGQKREVADAFRSMVEQRYYKRWHNMFLRAKMTFAGDVKAGGDEYVKTYVTSGKDEDTIVWRLHPVAGGGQSVVSLNVNGKDLISRISPRLQKQLEKKGPQGLIAWLKDKANSNDEDTDVAKDKETSNLRRRVTASKEK